MNTNLRAHLSNPIFAIVSQAATELGVSAYVIGGFVRDLLLERPSKDIDIVAIGSGIDLAELVNKKLGRNHKLTIYKNFGTALIKYDELDIEFVGARKESYRSESRKPIVENGTLEDDQNRRDFTINALAISLSADTFGKLLDPFDGRSDLKNKIIRTPLSPDITYSDDPLRMMRAIRFATQLNFTIEDSSIISITKNKSRIRIISGERITDELNKIVLSLQPSKGFKLLEKTGLLQIIFPKFSALKGVDVQKGKGHKDVFYHTLEVVDNVAQTSNNLWLRWAALLHDIAKPATKAFDNVSGWTFHGHNFKGAKMIPEIFKELKLPLGDNMKYVQKLVSLHLRPIVLSEEIVTDSAIRRLLFEAGEDIDDLMTLCEADITSKNMEKVIRYLKNFADVREKLREVEEKDKLRNWQPPISGADIMYVFELTPSRQIGVLKDAICEAILEGEIPNNFEEAYLYLLRKGAELGLVEKNILLSK